MATSPETTLARLSELLDLVDTSSKVLRTFLEAEQKRSSTPTNSKSFSQRVADELGLPFHADTNIIKQVSLLSLACERIKQTITSPRHVVFEAATSVSTIPTGYLSITD